MVTRLYPVAALLFAAILAVLVPNASAQVVFDYNPPALGSSEAVKRNDLNAELDGINAAKQGVDVELTCLAGLASAADRLPYFTGAATCTMATFTSYARTILDDASAAAAWATLTGDELAQDATGAMAADTATIDLTYTDAAPALTAAVVANSIGTAQIGTDGVAADEIAANAVGNAEMADNAIGLAEMADDAIGINELDLIDGDTPANGDCLTVNSATGGTLEAVACPGASGGDNVVVNAGAVSDPDFNNSTPAAPALAANVRWQLSGAAVSAHVLPSDWRTVVALATDNTVSTTAMADVTGMSCAVVANATYEVRLLGTFQTAATTTGIGVALDIPSGAVQGQALVHLATTTLNNVQQVADDAVLATSTGVAVINTDYPITGRWLVRVAATGGAIKLRQRSEVAASNTVLRAGAAAVAGTVMTCERII